MVLLKKLAIIGAGPIIPFHIQAARGVGLKVEHISSSPNSPSLKQFAIEHKINNYYMNSQDLLLKESEWDGIVIACQSKYLSEYLKSALKTGKPILVEKPVTLTSQEIEEIGLDHTNVLVGYNRRFYPVIADLKNKIKEMSPVFATIEIPEKIDFTSDLKSLNPLVLNSVHMFDLTHYLFGELKLISITHLKKQATTITFTSPKNHLVQMILNYNASANFSITVDSGSRRFMLKPLEMLTIFDQMHVNQPTKSMPVKTYSPIQISQVQTDDKASIFKPGFYYQYEEFHSMLKGQNVANGATLRDAYNALKIAEIVSEGVE